MNDNSDNSNLAELLAKALQLYAKQAPVAESTAAKHLADRLANTADVDFRIERVDGQLTLECFPIKFTTDKRKPRKRPRKPT